MVRKWGSAAFAVAVLVVLGFAMANPPRFADAAIQFSAPCEPASPAFQAADHSKAVSRIDSIFCAEMAHAPARAVRSADAGKVARAVPRPAPRDFPPLFHRPPPANS